MGTAVIGVIASANPGHFTALAVTMKDLSIGATALAALLGVLIAVPYLARWILYPRAAWADMRDPTVGPLHGTFPGGILVLAVAISAVGPQVLPVHSVPTVVEVLAAVGVPLALAISLLFAYLLFTLDLPDTRVVNGGWFIPPVVTIIVPVVLVPLLGQVGPSAARLLLFTGYAFWGVGFLLFLLVLGLLHDRLVTQALPAAAMAPSLWIVLGPIGVGAAALLDLAHAAPLVLGSKAAVIGTLTLVGASALWGFGAWSLLVALALLGRYLGRGGIPYGVGWWAFTFPLGALTLATSSLATAWALPVVSDIALGLLIGLVLLWLIVSAGTAGSLATGSAWTRPAAPSPTSPAGPTPSATGDRDAGSTAIPPLHREGHIP
jgi:C4-dicarboxylate transporter/malic acid transport protein